MPTPPSYAQDPVLVAFGAAIRRARLERSIPQEQLAHLSDLDRTYMSSVERGAQSPGVLVVVRIARALDMTVTELFAEAEL